MMKRKPITLSGETATTPRVLVAGVGNIFHGDDAFGVEVAQELAKREWPDAVQVGELGTRSYDLAYALMDDYDVAVLVDAAQQGGDPGDLYLIEPDLHALDELDGELVNGHSMNPVRTLHLVEKLGGNLNQLQLYLVGCEPNALAIGDGRMGLSETVQAAVPRAVEMIESLVNDVINGRNVSDNRGNVETH